MDATHPVRVMVSDELSMLCPTVADDEDENDHSDEKYVVSSESESDDNNDAEEEELRISINLVTENTVTQWDSSQWFSSARYDYTQFGAFLDMGSDSPIDELIEFGTLRLLDWNLTFN
ncbi:hypothetical protein M9H77_34969 [Catharanthus roseus]|uniref:Uncharacterized protein n=1 Tax=Catharanthus roseus TaxID=4058 RepID=A0ACB9ZMN9_CATRO|nr:hypothetical protein M9H77_34969 [Catharanthus roseus]